MNNKAKIYCADQEPRTNEAAPSVAVESVSAEKRYGLFEERPLPVDEIAPRVLRYRSRRDFLLFGAGAIAALAGGGFLLPQDTLRRMGGCTSKCELSREGVVSEQSTTYRR